MWEIENFGKLKKMLLILQKKVCTRIYLIELSDKRSEKGGAANTTCKGTEKKKTYIFYSVRARGTGRQFGAQGGQGL
jgi:hypothetical protein